MSVHNAIILLIQPVKQKEDKMPNWVYNDLSIDGNAEDIAKLKAQLNTPFTRQHDQWNTETNVYETKDITFSNPVFAFWNIIKPTDLEAYVKQPDHSLPLEETLKFESNDWYAWNVRNWGCKWDVAVNDDDKYLETELSDEDETFLHYHFNTAWGVADKALINLSSQYPDITLRLSFEEETGWGGEWVIKNGELVSQDEYGWQCRECDHTEDETPWCDDCEFDICPSCGYNESSEPCDEHKEKENA